MTITRMTFCAALGGATALLWLQGCGGGSDYSGGSSGGGASSCGASGSAIAGNHGHVLSIPKADLDLLADKTYSFTGSDHSHDVTFTPAQLQQLKTGATVMVTSTSGSGVYGLHTHVTSATVLSTCP